ncbi:MAG: cobyrinate a,c-diamide synthase [Caloramator sp.]|nr:cobyrinate a,c-diamide synthase [Caloramator sp.]
MKGIMITAPKSGSGKTTISLGIIRALVNKGYDVACFKTGPDYIDTAFLKAASKKDKAGNLDIHLQGKNNLKKSLGLVRGDICIIEGAMGYYDGIYNTYLNSSYDISKTLNINSILVYTPQGEMFSAIPKIKGLTEFENSNIKGIILNKVSEKYYLMLKEQIEKYINIEVLGYMPNIKDIEIKSRHLGLIQRDEIEDIEKKIELCAEYIKEYIDLEKIIELTREVENKPIENLKKRNIKVAVAMDKAFSFYYNENLYLLNSICDVKYFSPMYDTHLPDCDFLYLGGGYPEVFKMELYKNKPMRKAVRDFGEEKGTIYGECGGFMYLCNYIEDCEMVGLLNGEIKMSQNLQRFGYVDITIKDDCLLGKKDDKLTGHEFHKSYALINCKTYYSVSKTMGKDTWECGYSYKNVFGSYAHINFLGNIKALYNILDSIERR